MRATVGAPTLPAARMLLPSAASRMASGAATTSGARRAEGRGVRRLPCISRCHRGRVHVHSAVSDDSNAPTGTDVGSQDATERGIEDYGAMKQALLKRTAIAGCATSVYFLLVWSDEAAIGAATGAACAYAYLKSLQSDVDALPLDYKPIVSLPMERIRAKMPPDRTFSISEEVDNAIARAALQAYGTVTQALKRRMLLVLLLGPIGLSSQAITGGDGIPLLALVLGFFSYKAALVLQIWDDLKVLVVPKFDVDAFLKKYE